jgi:DNA-binding response OmpR family regulator
MTEAEKTEAGKTETEKPEPEKPETPAPAHGKKSQRVLLVDDDPNLLAAIDRHLRKRFEVVTAAGGHQALTAIEENGPFGVVVSDLQMPGLNGMRFLAKAREKMPDMVAVILSGNANIDAVLEAMNEGRIFRFLTKPCDTEVLAAAIEAGLERHAVNTAERRLFESDSASTMVAAFRTIKEMAAKAENSFDKLAIDANKAIAQAKADAVEPIPSANEMSSDPATGLPDWNAAQHAIRAIIKADYDAYLAIFHIARYDYTCYRYGAEIGNQILLICGQHAASDISPGLPVFRWKGPILLALIVSKESQATVRNAVHNFASVVRHQYFQTPSRTVYLQVRMSCDMMPLRGADANEVFTHIEQFSKLHEEASGTGQKYRQTML